MKTAAKILIFVLVGVGAFWANKAGFFEAILNAVRSWGVWAPPAFLILYILSCLLFFPSLVLTLAAGALFPVPAAIGLCLLGNGLGATLALLIGRYGLRDWVIKRAAHDPKFQKLESAVRQEGWKIMVLARLTPIFPFSIGNYLFGATSIPAWVYGLTAFTGTIPSASVYVWAGHLAAAQGGERERTPAEWILLGVGILATVVLSWYLKRFFDRLTKDFEKFSEH